MATYEVAHIRHQGVDLIIVLVKSAFGRISVHQQAGAANHLQACASSAGLAGTVVPVWDAGGGRMGFYAPRNWHGFFSSISLAFVARNINRKLTCR